ncbi:MAG: Eco57I restriction-modification methylase domain-containing protein [Candidatus Hodarchaeales archaeon]
MLQFISLLFFDPKSIPSSIDKGFTNWKEVYNYYGNPRNVFLLIKDTTIPKNIISVFKSKKQNQDEYLETNQLNTIDWGNIADHLSENYQWVNDYIDSKTTTTGLITLEIFDIIAAHLKKHESTFKGFRCEIYTPYRLATNIAEESLVHWFNNYFPDRHKFKSLSDVRHSILELNGKSRSLLLKKIDSIKILDPATGTSVFLFAVANLLLENLKSFKPNISTQELKIQILERNLFGIDIDPCAIKFSLMKFWLWAFCNEDLQLSGQINFKNNFYEGNALFGFQCLPTDYGKNNLTDLEIKEQKNLYDDQYDQKTFKKFALYKVSIPQCSIQGMNQLFKVSPNLIEHPSFKYFILEGDRAIWNSEKVSLDKIISKKVRFSASNSFNLYAVFSPPLTTQEEETTTFSLLEYKKYSIPKKFHWFFLGSTTAPKFDLIISNPPFVALTDLSMIKRKILQNLYPNVYTGNNDLSYFFIVRALSALHVDNGILSFILPKYLLHSVYARKIRGNISQSAKILEIHDFAEFSLFRNTSIKNIVLHLIGGVAPSDHTFNYNKYQRRTSQVNRETYSINQSDLKPEKWIFLDSPKLELLSRIKRNSNLMLKDVANISKGIETGCDRVFAPSTQSFFSKILKINRDHIRPWIKGKDIGRYSVTNTRREVLFAPNHRKHEVSTNKKIFNYLEENKSLLLNRSRVLEFYLWRTGDERKTMDWNSPKIISPYKSRNNTFAIDWKSSLSSKDVVWIIPKAKFSGKNFLLFLLSILNSEVLTFFALNSIKDLGGLYEYYPKQIQDFPLVVPNPDTPEYKSILKLISKLINNKDASKKNDLEAELNELIFALYSLSTDEIYLIKAHLNQNS